MSAHALASTALNDFILASNGGGDLRSAYTVVDGHCVSESTRGFTVQVVTLSIGSKDVGYGCSYPENMNNVNQPPGMYIGYVPPLALGSTEGHYVGLLKQPKNVKTIAVAKVSSFYFNGLIRVDAE